MVKVDVATSVLPKIPNGSGLDELDLDGDGDIDIDDLHRLVNLKHSQEKLIRIQKIGMFILSVVIVGVGVGLGLELQAASRQLQAANEATGDAIEEARVGSTNAHVIEAPSELQVESSRAGEGEASESTPVVDFVNKDDQPVRTDRTMDKLKLTSELPDEVFSELERLKIEGPDGSINFKVQGYARFNAEGASRCGTVVIVYTTMGHVQFDGTSMLFGRDVAGAFEKAGFRVSNQRRRRRSVGLGRHRRNVVEDVGHSLVGVNRMFGEFNFIKKVDLSTLSCGDEKPSIRTPFDGELYDVQVEEDNLIQCGTEESVCPVGNTVDGLNGLTYFKRRTQMRAKKMRDGVWRSIRSTAFPELDEDPSIPSQYHDGRFVELSNGAAGETYQYYPKAEDGELEGTPKGRAAVTAHCRNGIETFDSSTNLNFNDADIDEEEQKKFYIDFIGYDVFNNHYVKHFKIMDYNKSSAMPEGIDYLESFELDRMYAIGLFGDGIFNAYESIKTNGDVDPDFLQGVPYPDLDGAEFVDPDYSPTAQCTDEILYEGITEGNLEGGTEPLSAAQVASIRAERVAFAQRPNLQHLMTVPFDFDRYEETFVRKRSDLMYVLDRLFPEDPGCESGPDVCTGQRSRRAISHTYNSSLDQGGHDQDQALSRQGRQMSQLTGWIEYYEEQYAKGLIDATALAAAKAATSAEAAATAVRDAVSVNICKSDTFRPVGDNPYLEFRGRACTGSGGSGPSGTWATPPSVTYGIYAGGRHQTSWGLLIQGWGKGEVKVVAGAKKPRLEFSAGLGLVASFKGVSIYLAVRGMYTMMLGFHVVALGGTATFSAWGLVVRADVTLVYASRLVHALVASIPRAPDSVITTVQGCFLGICVGPIIIPLVFPYQRPGL